MSAFKLSRDQVRELDRRAVEEYGMPGIVLMENAGRGCAELLMRLNPGKRPVVVLCGPGNNGGDGFVIARHLDNHGWSVSTRFYITGPVTLPPDAMANFLIASRSGVLVASRMEPKSDWPNPSWIVDALFGTGLTRPLTTPHSDLVDLVNASGNSVLAVDLPSGLDCDTGDPLGPTIRATHTATFVAPKKGFLNPKSKEWTGEVHVIDIGAPRVLVEQYFPRS